MKSLPFTAKKENTHLEGFAKRANDSAICFSVCHTVNAESPTEQ